MSITRSMSELSLTSNNKIFQVFVQKFKAKKYPGLQEAQTCVFGFEYTHTLTHTNRWLELQRTWAAGR